MRAGSSSPASRHRRLFLLLQRCRSSPRLLPQLHAQIVLNGFSRSNSLLHKLISSCFSCGDPDRALRAFELAESPSVTVWNQIIRGLSRSAAPRAAFRIYSRMRAAADAPPNGYTYSFLLNACASPPLLREGAQVHGSALKCGFLSSAFVRTSLIDMYTSAEREGAEPRSARRVFDEMPHRNLAAWNAMLAGYLRSGNVRLARRMFVQMPERDIISWTTMISSCARLGMSKQALTVFCRMRATGMEMDQVTIVTTLSACADLGNLELGRCIHAYVDSRLGRSRQISVDNSLVNMYSKCGCIDDAYKIFRAMTRRTTLSWTTMIMGFVMHRRYDNALEIYNEMLHGAEQPDDVTFMFVLCACSHTGRVGEGRSYFKEMTTHFLVEPTIRHYCCMVDMLGRSGHLEDACALIHCMPMEPNDAIWSALLSGCRAHGNSSVFNNAAGVLLELGGGGNLAFLSNLYAACGKWDDALLVRKRLVERGLHKPAARSWVLVDGCVHEFMAGDQRKQCDATVYDMLHEMTERAKGAGYMPDLSQVLLDVEEEEKERFLYNHSEKLAMAYAMTKMTDARAPIRITMNLRMCCDCHSLARFVSQNFQRDLIVRERNRFHHFFGGTCSCNY